MHFNPFRLLFLQFCLTNLMIEVEFGLFKFWFIHGIHSSIFDSSRTTFLSFIWILPVGDGKVWNISEKEKSCTRLVKWFHALPCHWSILNMLTENKLSNDISAIYLHLVNGVQDWCLIKVLSTSQEIRICTWLEGKLAIHLHVTMATVLWHDSIS